MWVRLNSNHNIVTKGVLQQYRKGDIVDLGRHIAEGWVKSGEATLLEAEADGKHFPATAGLLVRGYIGTDLRSRINTVGELRWAFAIDGLPEMLPFTETLILTPTFQPRLDRVVDGFNLLKRFQLAVPIRDYRLLALSVGTDEQREQAQKVLRDLRVPLRDTRLVFVKRCKTTNALLQQWSELVSTGMDERLAFLMAVYSTKPLVCDLPATWSNNG